MNETKPWYESKGMWGGIISLIAGLLGIFGIPMLPEIMESFTEVFTALAAAVGGVLAVYGRWRATHRLS